ncbi:MAG: hypothetical protein F4030_01680 [Gammaproteobacteria bacterium]|nr:hypothetical protein [Gammaproteobacteria bacterium]MYK03683.1 hypothetical protein [Gammaproteobacteria bacterium]
MIKLIRADAKFRQSIDTHFVRPKRDVGRVLLVRPPMPAANDSVYRAGRVGTAFDYLFRLVLRRWNPGAAVIESPWIAEHSRVQRELKLDEIYDEFAREEIRQGLLTAYRWRESESGLDCKSINSMTSNPGNPWLSKIPNPHPQATMPVAGLRIHDKWLGQCLREKMSFEEIVEALFLALGDHRKTILEYREAITGARFYGERFVRSGKIHKHLPGVLLKISNLDTLHRISRTNFLPPNPAPYFTEPIPQREVDDLLELYKAIPRDLFVGDRVFLNPELSLLNRDIKPAPSKLVGGGVKADADAIIDDLLLEVKTSKTKITQHLPLQDFCQLMGYFALTSLWGNHQIKRLGIYYARFGYLFEFPIPRALPNKGGRSAFIEWFRKYVKIDKRRVPKYRVPKLDLR